MATLYNQQLDRNFKVLWFV